MLLLIMVVLKTAIIGLFIPHFITYYNGFKTVVIGLIPKKKKKNPKSKAYINGFKTVLIGHLNYKKK